MIRGEVLDYDPRVERLSDGAYRLFMLTLYSRGRTMLGLMRFVPADVVPRVRGWDEARATAALEELMEAGLVEYDADRRVLFNPSVMEHSPVRGVNNVRGGWAVLAELPDSPVIAPAAEMLFLEAQGVLGDGDRKLSGKIRRELEAITEGLEARLVGLRKLAQASPPGGDRDGVGMVSECHPDGIGMGSGCHRDGVEMVSGCHRDDIEMGSECHPDGVKNRPTTNCISQNGHTTSGGGATPSGYHPDGVSIPSEWGLASCARARAHACPDPYPKEKTPPNPPAPERTEQGGEAKRGREREGGRYGKLGQGSQD